MTPPCHYCVAKRPNGVRACYHLPHPGCGWTRHDSRRRVHVCIDHAYVLRMACADDEV